MQFSATRKGGGATAAASFAHRNRPDQRCWPWWQSASGLYAHDHKITRQDYKDWTMLKAEHRLRFPAFKTPTFRDTASSPKSCFRKKQSTTTVQNFKCLAKNLWPVCSMSDRTV